eukprot:scaffold589783_cov14-Prasinocladus_malaysianus.AAC.1
MSVHMASHLSFSTPCMLGAKSPSTTVIDLVSSSKEDSNIVGGPLDASRRLTEVFNGLKCKHYGGELDY